MRIVNIPLNENKVTNNKILDEGSILKAKILEIDGDNIILLLENGEIFEAKTEVDMEGLKNKLLFFLVKNIEMNKVFLAPINQEEATIINNETVTIKNSEEIFVNKVLDTYNLPKNDDNELIIKTMLSLKIPLTKENVTFIMKNVEKLNVLKNIQHGDKIFALNPEKSPLNENIMKFIKTNSSIIINDDVLKQNELINNSNSSSNSITKENISTDDQVGNQLRPQNSTVFKDVTETIYPKLEELFPKNTISTSLIKKIVFLTQLGANISLENLGELTNLIDKGEGITKRLLDLIRFMNSDNQNGEKTLEKNISFLNKIDFTYIPVDKNNTIDKETVEKFFFEIKNTIDNITPTIMNKKNMSEELNIKFNNLLDSTELFNKINSFYSLIHIPIEFNKEKDNNNVFILRKKNKLKSNNFSIFISLNTNKLSKVDVFCNINKETINIELVVEKQFNSFFNNKIGILKEALINLGYKNIAIRLKEDKANNMINMFLDDDILNYNLNIRV